jgi:hypothetical protein
LSNNVSLLSGHHIGGEEIPAWKRCAVYKISDFIFVHYGMRKIVGVEKKEEKIERDSRILWRDSHLCCLLNKRRCFVHYGKSGANEEE